MTYFKQKFKYLLRSLAARAQQRSCPFCGRQVFEQVDSKYFGITRLLKCASCKLQHRHPKDDERFLNKFYQEDYSVDVGMITDLPDAEKLAELQANHFASFTDFSPVIRAALPGKTSISVLDYGCSWGYNVAKLNHAGMSASGYELSVPRAEFGRRHLNITLTWKEKEIPEGNDVFFSSHVIEHLPSIGNFVDLSRSKLAPDGIFMAFCPNGSKEYRERDFKTFHVTWGGLHPLYLDIEFAQELFSNNPYLILTSDSTYDLDAIAAWDGRSQQVAGRHDGYELLMMARPNISISNK